MCLLWIFPEVIDLAVGMGAKAGAVGEAEVVLQDGGNQAGKTWVSSKGCEVEGDCGRGRSERSERSSAGGWLPGGSEPWPQDTMRGWLSVSRLLSDLFLVYKGYSLGATESISSSNLGFPDGTGAWDALTYSHIFATTSGCSAAISFDSLGSVERS